MPASSDAIDDDWIWDSALIQQLGVQLSSGDSGGHSWPPSKRGEIMLVQVKDKTQGDTWINTELISSVMWSENLQVTVVSMGADSVMIEQPLRHFINFLRNWVTVYPPISS